MKEIRGEKLGRVISFIGLIFFLACGNDDTPEAPDIIEGKWKLEVFQLTEAPAGFESYEGKIVQIHQLGLGWQDYVVEFRADHTYDRRIYLSGADRVDGGSWAKDGDRLLMVSNADSTFDEEYSIEENDEEELIWSEPIQISVVEDAILDTLTQEYADTLTDEEFEALYTEITIKLNYIFNKEQAIQ